MHKVNFSLHFGSHDTASTNQVTLQCQPIRPHSIAPTNHITQHNFNQSREA